jgi:endonuclease YncB( thermonuclease family)
MFGLRDWRYVCELTLALALCTGTPTRADTLAGRVVGVTDGDTITVLDEARTQHKIRLAGIDAPERGQPFGQRSKQHLSDLISRKDVVVEWKKRDRYGLDLGKVLAPGTWICEQIRAGMAWWYRSTPTSRAE